VASTSKSKVVERVKALEQARDRGQLGNLSKPWTVESWLEYWLENVSRPFVKQSTYEGYRAAVRVHLIPGVGRPPARRDRRARAHDHERSGLVNDRDGEPLHARNHADPQ
jgi:hypothetical protein